MKKIIAFIAFLLITANFVAQEKLTYQKPPKEILELVDAPLAPSVWIDSKGENVVLFYRDTYKSIAELSETEMRLGGLRINPKTNIGSRTRYFNNIMVKKAIEKDARQVTGIPKNARLSYFTTSPNQKIVAFLNTSEDGVQLWVADIEKATAKKLSTLKLNANMGNPINWFKDSKTLLVNVIPTNRKELINTSEAVPEGPTVTVSAGEKAQNRTYQDLLGSPNDEYNFEQLAISEVKKISLEGSVSDFLPIAMYNDIKFSPDGNYVMVNLLKRPFSYIVPYYRFPFETNIYRTTGELIQKVNEVPLNEVEPKGFMATRTGKRSMGWRSDKAATLYWAEALDKGDPEVKVDFRDAVYELEAPFNGKEKLLLKTINRYSGITWGDANFAIATDYWWNDRNTKTYIFNPSNASETPKIIFDRSYQDKYSDPGNFVTRRNDYDERVLDMDNGNTFLMGDGFSEKGQFPFIDEFNLKTQKTKRIYQSSYTDKLENLNSAIDIRKGKILVRIESQNEYPNYYFRNINKKNDLTPVTSYENPFKSIQNVHKEVITYKRDDGLELEGTLYLPIGYDMKKKEKMPMILWAYPREFKDKNNAGQNTTNPNEFIYP